MVIKSITQPKNALSKPFESAPAINKAKERLCTVDKLPFCVI